MMNPTFDYMITNNMINTNTDKFNRTAPTTTNISANKITVMLERYPNLKGTPVEEVLKTFVAIIAESDKHIAAGDVFFDYANDRIKAEVRIDMLVSVVYRKEGNVDKIKNDICFISTKSMSTELSDHYWAVPHNN